VIGGRVDDSQVIDIGTTPWEAEIIDSATVVTPSAIWRSAGLMGGRGESQVIDIGTTSWEVEIIDDWTKEESACEADAANGIIGWTADSPGDNDDA
jgi:hypothetical protein